MSDDRLIAGLATRKKVITRGVIAFNVLVAIVCAGLIYAEIEEQTSGLEVRLDDIVATSSIRSENVIKSADSALRVAQNVHRGWALGRIAGGDVAKRLIEIKNSSQLLSGIGWADRSGNVQFSSHVVAAKQMDVSDAEFFDVHAENSDQDLFIAEPVVDPIDGRPLVTLSRRLVDPAGNFDGVVVANFDAGFIEKFFS